MTTGTALRRAVLALSLAVAACGGDDDGFSPSMSNVSGSYHATTFTAGQSNLLALGATVDVTLLSNGTTTGHLTVPLAGDNGTTLEEDLAGTWTLSGNTVTFSQSAGTLIEAATFTAEENRLTGSGTFKELALLLVLTKNS
jgi:hypothetical protein